MAPSIGARFVVNSDANNEYIPARLISFSNVNRNLTSEPAITSFIKPPLEIALCYKVTVFFLKPATSHRAYLQLYPKTPLQDGE